MELQVRIRSLDSEHKHEYLDYFNHATQLARHGNAGAGLDEEAIGNIIGDYGKDTSLFGQARVIFAQVGGKAIGMARYFLRHGTSIAEIDKIHVNPGFRGMGIGYELMDWITGEARMMGCRKIVLTPAGDDSIRFYKRLGFKANSNNPNKITKMWLDLDDNCWFCDSNTKVH